MKSIKNKILDLWCVSCVIVLCLCIVAGINNFYIVVSILYFNELEELI